MAEEVIDGKLWEHCIWLGRLVAKHLREKVPDPTTDGELVVFRAQLELLDNLVSDAARQSGAWWSDDALQPMDWSQRTGLDSAGAAKMLETWAAALENQLRQLGWFED